MSKHPDGTPAVLHLLRHAPLEGAAFGHCLRTLGAAHGVVLIEDAVYALNPGTSIYVSLAQLPATVSLYALDTDMIGRGVSLALPARITVIGYAELVQLCVEYDKVLSW
ncbi:MAG TPA: sulfurtransferase complex subunit TusB [Pseudomonas xinjiangensis]|uniref:Sulfurtransferase complex subunit TusB n=2 Tax=root TaxID=1 RepID=A0A7V1FQ41_9GAMM|nr:sulfurtransferase complex subunit TusB [Halopseudomonas xinjiangensis]HEC47768.1 sulfurtransferase complex subunit TusB [Halopseudomonas xinjiangensis]